MNTICLSQLALSACVDLFQKHLRYSWVFDDISTTEVDRPCFRVVEKSLLTEAR